MLGKWGSSGFEVENEGFELHRFWVRRSWQTYPVVKGSTSRIKLPTTGSLRSWKYYSFEFLTIVLVCCTPAQHSVLAVQLPSRTIEALQ